MSDTERAETSETTSEEEEEEEVVRMPREEEGTQRQKENGEKMEGGHVVIEPEVEVDSKSLLLLLLSPSLFSLGF
jgi:hypothetical protein